MANVRICKECRVHFQRVEHSGRYVNLCRSCASFKKRLSNYNLSAEQFYALGDFCHICWDSLPDPKDRRIDHNPETGQVRGILCNSCNLGLGMFKDSPERLTFAIDYLQGGDFKWLESLEVR
jgi:hypothetical protein